MTGLARLAYETWQRARGVPGDARWDLMPPNAQEGWRITAQAVAAAERDRIAASTAVRLAHETLSMDRLGLADMTLDEAAGQIGILVASLRMALHAITPTGGDPR